MGADDPTPRELLIQLQGAVSQINALAVRLDGLTQTLSTTYLPRGEYAEAREANNRRVGEIEKDIENQAAFRRQVAAALLVGLLLLIADIITRVQGVGT